MRRNESAAAQLQYVGTFQWQEPLAQAPLVRKNKSSTALSELGRREQSLPASHADRPAVIEAVVHELMQQMERSTSGSEQPEELAKAMKSYIETIVKQLDLPNSCIIAMLVYVDRAVSHERFELTPLNWQPCLLAAFVVSAKTSFDEPVWNEDFVRRCRCPLLAMALLPSPSACRWIDPCCASSRAQVKALRISNVPVAQISRWEASFLTLIEFNTTMGLKEYAGLCFRLQQRYQELHGERVQFFTYLMLQAQSMQDNGHGNEQRQR